MTTDAQSALRRTMETHSKVTRFFILCNYVSRIIEPIASRCAKFRFKPLGQEVMGERLRFIAGKEAVTLGDGAEEAAADVSGGDLRKAITLLQSAARLFGSDVITGKDITRSRARWRRRTSGRWSSSARKTSTTRRRRRGRGAEGRLPRAAAGLAAGGGGGRRRRHLGLAEGRHRVCGARRRTRRSWTARTRPCSWRRWSP